MEGWLFAKREKEGGAKTAGLDNTWVDTSGLTDCLSVCLSVCLFRLIHVLVQQAVVCVLVVTLLCTFGAYST